MHFALPVLTENCKFDGYCLSNVSLSQVRKCILATTSRLEVQLNVAYGNAEASDTL